MGCVLGCPGDASAAAVHQSFPHLGLVAAPLQVQHAIDKYPDRVGRVAGVIQFKITGSSDWVIDLTVKPGVVRQVRAPPPGGHSRSSHPTATHRA